MRTRIILALVWALFLSVTVVGAVIRDVAHVQSDTSPVIDDAEPTFVTSLSGVTAGNTVIFGWYVNEIGFASCGTMATDDTDTVETLVEQVFGTTLRNCIAIICNAIATGGTTVGTVTHSGGTGVFAGVHSVSEFSDIVDSACVEDTAGNTASGVTTLTSDVVTTAGAALIHGLLSTNQNPAADGAGTARWEGISTTDSFSTIAQDKRVSASGNHTLAWTFDVSAALAYNVVALTEDVGGGAPAGAKPGQINNPSRGGGLLARWLDMLGLRPPYSPARLVQTKTRGR